MRRYRFVIHDLFRWIGSKLVFLLVWMENKLHYLNLLDLQIGLISNVYKLFQQMKTTIGNQDLFLFNNYFQYNYIENKQIKHDRD